MVGFLKINYARSFSPFGSTKCGETIFTFTDLFLRRLTALEADKIKLELEELLVKIADFKDILENREMVFDLIQDELNKLLC